MDFFTDAQAALDARRAVVGEVEPVAIPAVTRGLDDDALVALIEPAPVVLGVGESVLIAA
jgi:hypothetical protein